RTDHSEAAMKARVGRFNGDNAANQVEHCPYVVLDSYRMQTGRTPNESVVEIDDPERRQYSKKPSSPRIKIIPVTAVILQVIRKEERTEEIKENAVNNHKKVKRQSPCRDLFQSEFPPPESYQ